MYTAAVLNMWYKTLCICWYRNCTRKTGHLLPANKLGILDNSQPKEWAPRANTTAPCPQTRQPMLSSPHSCFMCSLHGEQWCHTRYSDLCTSQSNCPSLAICAQLQHCKGSKSSHYSNWLPPFGLPHQQSWLLCTTSQRSHGTLYK